MRIVLNDSTAVFDRIFCDSDTIAFIDQIDALMDAGAILKNGNTCYVSRVTWNGKDVVIKRYNNKGFIHSLRHTIKRPRARRCWLNAYRLNILGIETPTPLAYIEKRKGPVVWQSYLVTEFVNGVDICHFLEGKQTSKQECDAVIRQVKGVLERLKSHCICHGDMKPANIIVGQMGPSLIDLDAMTVLRWKWLFFFRKSKDYDRLRKGISI
ncbi:MAG: lipopolysaccharide kinase InaA family protein [Phycisphaerae bacterium]|nr:lipopolysaccharide kinase InaA family protein [Phycisphaerae bacterium]